MAKLLEKNAAEMAASLVNISAPIKHFLEDEEFMELFREKTAEGIKNKTKDVLTVYAALAPLLFGEKHLKDVLTILAEVEGTDVKDMIKMNGTELLADALIAWNDQIAPFFTRLGLSV